MTATKAKRTPMEEQLRLITECRKSGLTDADWCRKNDISVSTFYNWISRCRRKASLQLPEPSYGHSETPQPKQDVVSVDIVPDPDPEQPDVLPVQDTGTYLDNSHSIEIEMHNLTIRISNHANPALLSGILKLLRETVC